MALRDHFPTFQGVRQRLHFGDGLGRMRARLTAIRPRGRRLALVSGLAALLAIIAVIFVFYAPPRLSLVGPTETRPGGFTDVQLCTHLAEYHVLGSAGIALATGRTAQARGHTPCVAVNSGFWDRLKKAGFQPTGNTSADLLRLISEITKGDYRMQVLAYRRGTELVLSVGEYVPKD